MTVRGVLKTLVVLTNSQQDDGRLMDGLVLHQGRTSLDFFPASCAHELLNRVEVAFQSGDGPEFCSFASLEGHLVGIDQSFSVVSEDGLGTAVVDIEGERGLGISIKVPP